MVNLVSSEITCSCSNLSSAASSIVIILSSGEIKEDNTFKSVVFPLPVPPQIIMFSFASTHASKNLAIYGVSAPVLKKSSMFANSSLNLRIVKTGPFKESGGITALSLEPSTSLASTIGFAVSMVLPSG